METYEKNKRMGKIIERQAGVEPVTFGLGSRNTHFQHIEFQVFASISKSY